MKTILIWYLVTIGGYGSDQVVWSPPIATQAECERIKTTVSEARPGRIMARCIQLSEVVKS